MFLTLVSSPVLALVSPCLVIDIADVFVDVCRLLKDVASGQAALGHVESSLDGRGRLGDPGGLLVDERGRDAHVAGAVADGAEGGGTDLGDVRFFT